MPVTRWAISLDQSLAKEIKRSAAREPISAWLADAARAKLRREGILRVIADYEADYGVITEEELEAARREIANARLGIKTPRPKIARPVRKKRRR